LIDLKKEIKFFLIFLKIKHKNTERKNFKEKHRRNLQKTDFFLKYEANIFCFFEMIHYQRNLKLIFFIILPILGFLLGWTLSLKISQPQNTNTKDSTKEITISLTGNEDLRGKNPALLKKMFARPKNPKDIDLSLLWETWGYLEESYLKKESFKTQEQVYGMIRGLVTSLEDPHTNFLSPEETKNFEESLSGEFEGIGAEIGIRNDQVKIITPIKGTPAEKAGLRAGDVIFKINNTPAAGMSVEDAVTKIRGPKGEKVDLVILRKDYDDPINISIVRDTIFVKSIEMKKKDNFVILEFSQFGTDLNYEFQKIVAELALAQPTGIIIDLRNNSGGLLESAVQIASEFLERTVVVKTKGRKFGDTGEIMSRGGGAFLKTPLIVLINEGSASASEILAGAIQDYNRGVILGEKSYGKGSVQNIIPLSDGSSLKVTIAEWLTPNGHSIQDKGITPDETIKRTREDYESGNDPALKRAMEILKNNEIETILSKKTQTKNEP